MGDIERRGADQGELRSARVSRWLEKRLRAKAPPKKMSTMEIAKLLRILLEIEGIERTGERPGERRVMRAAMIFAGGVEGEIAPGERRALVLAEMEKGEEGRDGAEI